MWTVHYNFLLYDSFYMSLKVLNLFRSLMELFKCFIGLQFERMFSVLDCYEQASFINASKWLFLVWYSLQSNLLPFSPAALEGALLVQPIQKATQPAPHFLVATVLTQEPQPMEFLETTAQEPLGQGSTLTTLQKAVPLLSRTQENCSPSLSWSLRVGSVLSWCSKEVTLVHVLIVLKILV